MTGWTELERLLRTDPRDAGCGQTRQLLHVYAELVTGGQDPERELPGITVHLAACAPCAQDFEGLLHLMASDEGDLDGPHD